MYRHDKLWVWLFWLACFAGLSACGTSDLSGQTIIKVQTKGLSASNVVRVTATLSGPEFQNVVQELLLENGIWRGYIGAIPTGPNRTVLIQAFDSNSTLLYEGQMTGVTVTENEQTLMFLLQQKVPPAPFQNAVPEVTGVVLSANTVAPGDKVSIASTAQDADTTDTLTYLWTATGGTFNNSTSSSPDWTAPSALGPHTLTLQVSDNRGGSVTASFDIQVQ